MKNVDDREAFHDLPHQQDKTFHQSCMDMRIYIYIYSALIALLIYIYIYIVSIALRPCRDIIALLQPRLVVRPCQYRRRLRQLADCLAERPCNGMYGIKRHASNIYIYIYEKRARDFA
jgi:Flp pilus assembly protein TadB